MERNRVPLRIPRREIINYENEIEKMLSMLDMDSIRETLESKGKSPMK